MDILVPDIPTLDVSVPRLFVEVAIPAPEVYVFQISTLDSARDVLRRAKAVWKAASYDSGILVDEKGNNATVSGALYLPYEGEKYLYLAGAAPNGAYVADTESFQGNEIDVRVRLSKTFWPTGGTYHTVISKYNTGTKQRTFEIRLGDSGFNVYASRDGATTTALNASSSGLPTNVPIWLRATYSATSGNLALFWSRDAEGWTSLGSTSGTSGKLFKTGIPVGVGIRPQTMAQGCPGGGFYRATVIEDGQVTLDFNPANIGSWVISRSTSGYKAALVDRPLLLLDGVDDYLSVPHSTNLDASTSGFTVVAAVRLQSGRRRGELVSKKQSSASGHPGYRSLVTTGYPRGQISDGTTSVTNSASGTALGTGLVSMQITPSQVRTYINGVLSTSTAHSLSNTLSNSRSLYIGALEGTSSFLAGEFIGAAVFQELLSEDEMKRVAQQFGV